MTYLMMTLTYLYVILTILQIKSIFQLKSNPKSSIRNTKLLTLENKVMTLVSSHPSENIYKS